jgi:hypothetical protein
MIHLGIIATDGHQRTVELTSHLGTTAESSLNNICLHIFDINSRHPYRSYFFEGWPWANISVYRFEEPQSQIKLLELLRDCSSDLDGLALIRNDYLLYHTGWNSIYENTMSVC